MKTVSNRTKSRLREHTAFTLVETARSVISLGGEPGVLLACRGCSCGTNWLGWLPAAELSDEFLVALPRKW